MTFSKYNSKTATSIHNQVEMGSEGYIHLYSVAKLKELGLYEKFIKHYVYKGEELAKDNPFLKEDIIYFYDGDNIDDIVREGSDADSEDFDPAFLRDWFIWS